MIIVTKEFTESIPQAAIKISDLAVMDDEVGKRRNDTNERGKKMV